MSTLVESTTASRRPGGPTARVSRQSGHPACTTPSRGRGGSVLTHRPVRRRVTPAPSRRPHRGATSSSAVGRRCTTSESRPGHPDCAPRSLGCQIPPILTCWRTVRFTPAPLPLTAAADLRAIQERCTDRRRFTSWPVPDERLRLLVQAVEDDGGHAVALTDVTDRFRVELMVARAHRVQERDAEIVAEAQRWTDRSAYDGLASDHLPARPGRARHVAQPVRRGAPARRRPGGRDRDGCDRAVRRG